MSSPSSMIRIMGLGYITLLKHAHVIFKGWEIIPSCTILQLCMVSILSLHLPALWSGQVNLQRCVSQLEKTVLYFGVLQMMVLWWGNGSAEENAYAALCLSWYVWNNIGQEWLPTPELMKSTLVVYFVACVPILWLQSPKVAAWPPLSIPMLFLCDISLLALECISLAYGRLWELLLAI